MPKSKETPEFELSAQEIAEMIAEAEAEVGHKKTTHFCIRHHYDIGDQRVFVSRKQGDVDAKLAALYCQFKCEEWFGVEKMLSNLGVAALLVAFYGYQHCATTNTCTEIDMHLDRERACGDGYRTLMANTSLQRNGLREVMLPHVTG